jgi:NAD(P)-dependent dehydrogenase (short-subunit alcohol dehydrogenase family)
MRGPRLRPSVEAMKAETLGGADFPHGGHQPPVPPGPPDPSARRALITGASRGLGRALADGLAAAGYSLVIDARDAGALDAAAAAIRASVPGAEVIAVPGDVTDPAHRSALRAAAGQLDLLVNNASTLGAAPLPALADYPLGELRTAFETNVLAPVALVQLFLPALRERGGAVLNITSDAAVEPYSGWGGYGAAKAALEQASNVLAAEEPAIRVWWVDPGDLRTDMHQAAFPGEDISDRPLPSSVVPALVRLAEERLPSGRYAAAELVAA